MRIDMGLTNAALYAGCQVEEVAGRLNLRTPVVEAIQIVGCNIGRIVEEERAGQGRPGDVSDAAEDEITLTGPMAIWAYLVVFHVVVHRYGRVYYDDGRSGPVLVAAHG